MNLTVCKKLNRSIQITINTQKQNGKTGKNGRSNT